MIFLRLRFFCFFISFLLLGNFVLGEECDWNKFEELGQQIISSSEAPGPIENLIDQVSKCASPSVVQDDTDNHEDSESDMFIKEKLLNKLYYKLGLAYISLGDDERAIISLNSTINIKGGADDIFGPLAKTRVNKLYVQLGLWDNIKDNDDVLIQFKSLNQTLNEQLMDSNFNIDSIMQNIDDILLLSPYEKDILNLKVDLLLEILSNKINDHNTAFDIIDLINLILKKHSTRIDISMRLNFLYKIAVLELIVLTKDPRAYLRECMAIDPTYEPCKQLYVFNSEISQSCPPPSFVLNKNDYLFSSKVAHFDWSSLLKYYLNTETEELMRKVTGTKSQHNVQEFSNIYEYTKFLSNYFFHSILPQPIFTLDGSTNFVIYLDSMLCHSSTLLGSKESSKFCNNAMKSILEPKEYDIVKTSFYNKKTIISHDILLKLLIKDPPALVYYFQKYFSKNKYSAIDETIKSKKVLTQFSHFFKKHNLNKSKNEILKESTSIIKSCSIKLQNYMKKKKAHMHQKQQQQYRQQQQYQQHQQHQQQRFHQQQRQRQMHQPQHGNDKDYYKILGVTPNSDPKEIKKAYRSLVKKYHPDKQAHLPENKQKHNLEKMAQINEAYEKLTDEQKRKEYDLGRQQQHGHMQRPPPGNPHHFQNNFRHGRQQQHDNFGNFRFHFNFV